mmetsp:Transcript_47838/g.86251  ORF Transcript_47838/g.86251 Transcript_47838/m.86251 type:complete len:531 (+) Transcript_47838:96-1688(+)
MSVGKLVKLSALICVTAYSQMMRRDQHGKRAAGGARLQAALRQEMAGLPASRLLEVEESLRPNYEAFPKDARGNLPPKVLAALVRSHFAKDHGWNILGLELPGAPIIAPGSTWQASSPAGQISGEVFHSRALQEKTPELAAALKEMTEASVATASGLSLSDVVRTVAVLEQLLLAQSVPLLRSSYFLNGFIDSNQTLENSESRPVTEAELHQALQSFLLLFRHGLPRNITDVKSHARMKRRAIRSGDWKDLLDFEKGVVNESEHLKDSSGKFSWAAASATVTNLAEAFGTWQNRECMEMKAALQEMDHKGTGRVSLADFHGAPTHLHFTFAEKEDYLRKAGILAEDDMKKPEVLIANYLLGPSNCIASSEYFSVCCLNECEAIVTEIEKHLQAPAATLEQIMEAVKEVRAARQKQDAGNTEISEVLVQALSVLADTDGAVVLHAPAYRQWLHQVFPAECPKLTSREIAAEEAELVEAREWLEIDDAARQKWQPMVLRPEECSRVPAWHTMHYQAEVPSDADDDFGVVEEM